MNAGGRLLAAAAVIAVAACSNEGKLEVRSIGNRSAAADAPLPEKLAEGYAQLKLGNAGLASELFRRALREDPASAEANAGMASSYERMGRFDLSRRYFEAALAIEPADTHLLERYAASLDREGARDEAAGVRAEIATRLAAAHQEETTAFVAAMEPEAVQAEIAVAPPKARPAVPFAAPAASIAQAPVARPIPVVAPVAIAVAPLARPFATAAPVAIAEAPIARAEPVGASLAAASVTVKLPPATPAPVQAAAAAVVPEPVEVAAAPVAPEPVEVAMAPAAPVAMEQPPEQAAVSLRTDPRGPDSPRLQRLSLAEVVLVTTGVSRWRPHVVAQNNQSTTIRFVPLKKPQQHAVAGLRLLNAARSNGLAARTRDYLTAKGWRRIAVGNASETRETSIIYFPEARRRTAEILAAQFRIRVARRSGTDQAIVMLLGRDVAGVKGNRTSA